MNYKDRDIYQKAIKFSISIIDQTNKLPKSFSNMVISRQLIRSSTSIGANIAEGSAGVSRKEFINYLNIARKSAIESEHWLNLLIELGFSQFQKFISECTEIIKILTVIIKNSKKNQ